MAALLLPVCSADASGEVNALLNGRSVEGAFLRDGVTMLPLRAVGEGLGYSVGWDASANRATVAGGGLSMSVRVGDCYLVANGRYIYLGSAARTVNGRLYLPARPLAKALGLTVRWDGRTFTAALASGGERLKSGSEFYDAEELDLLARIISAEARGEPLTGQIAVGQVILNRVRSREFPNTVHDVIFDRKYGVQFEPTINGEIWREPTQSSVIAAKLALDGADVVGGSLYFLNPAIAASNWITNNRPYYSTIGAHKFYL